MEPRICIIEDEPLVAQGLRNLLRANGYAADAFLDARTGMRSLKSESYSLLILDVILPDHNGFHLLEELRSVGNQIPVLLLTACDSLEDKVQGLDLGANDYLTKPFDNPELLARIRRILRDRMAPGEMLSCGDVFLDPRQNSVTRNGTPIDLSQLEFALLQYMMENKNQIVSRAMLARDVWKTPSRATPIDNVIEVAVHRLREVLDKPFPVPLILTIRGAGYMMREPSEEASR